MGRTHASIRLRLAWILVVLCSGGCGAPEPPPPSFGNVAAGVDFVGDAACATCHEDAYAGYQAHGMARSFYRLTDSTRIEPLTETPIRDPAMGYAYAAAEDEDGLYQEETLLDSTGAVLHRLRRRMEYVVGSGNAARTYFAEAGGRLYQLPLTFYTQDGRWDFSPGYAQANARFGRLMPDRCMACHNSIPEAVPHVEGAYEAVPEGIGCERCHGPGALHVEARLADPEPPAVIDTTIVNPAHLPFERRLDVCQQCHLHTTVAVLREGRGAFDFRPSEALSDHVAFFVAHEPATGGAIDVVSHADRMKRSACFAATQAAAQPLECITCHDPHEGFREAGPAYFNDTCRSCHAPEALPAGAAHAATADCAACHMPRVAAADAPHASFTDHWIRVPGTEEPLPDEDAEILEPYFERDRGNREGQAYLGMALVVHGRQRADAERMAAGAATLDAALSGGAENGEARFLLGVAHQQLGAADRAVTPLEAAVRRDPKNPQRLEALARAYAAAGRAPAAVEGLYRQALAIQPARARTRLGYGHFLLAQGRAAEAASELEAALAEEPWLDGAAFALGLARAAQGRAAEAAEALREALRLEPQHAGALARLLVAETDGSTVQALRAEALVEHPLVARAAGRGVRLAPEAAAVRIDGLPAGAGVVRVYTEDGLLLRSFETPGGRPLWDLRDAAGRLLPSGRYLLHVRPQRGGVQIHPFALVVRPAR